MTVCVTYAMQTIFVVFVYAKTLNSRLKYYQLGNNASTMFLDRNVYFYWTLNPEQMQVFKKNN